MLQCSTSGRTIYRGSGKYFTICQIKTSYIFTVHTSMQALASALHQCYNFFLLRVLQNIFLRHISSKFRSTNIKISCLSQEEVMGHSLPRFPNLVQMFSADLTHRLHFIHLTGYHLYSSFSRAHAQSYSLTLSITQTLVLPPIAPHIPPSYTSITPTDTPAA